MLAAQQPSTFLHFFYRNQMLQLFTFLSCFLLHHRKKHNGSLYTILVVYRAYNYEVYVAPLLRRRVFTGLIDSSCFFLALSTFWLSISFLQILCHNTELVIMSCITSCVLSQPTTTRNVTTITNLPKTMKLGNSANLLNSTN